MHAAAQRKAAADLRALRAGGRLDLERLCALQAVTPQHAAFIPAALALLQHCRCVLKHTYAYAFVCGAESPLFAFVQGEAEYRLEELAVVLEGQPGIAAFARQTQRPAEFALFRDRTVGLTGCLASYFHRLVASIEKGGEENGLAPAAPAPAAPAAPNRGWRCFPCW